MENKMYKSQDLQNFFARISSLIEQAKSRIASTINEEMVLLYWNIGKTMREEIIKSERALYGKQIVSSLSRELTQKYGRGY